MVLAFLVPVPFPLIAKASVTHHHPGFGQHVDNRDRDSCPHSVLCG